MLERENNIQVSVVIPVYNAQDTVLDAVRSVEAQTFKDYEVIIGKLRDILEQRLTELEKEQQDAGAPWMEGQEIPE